MVQLLWKTIQKVGLPSDLVNSTLQNTPMRKESIPYMQKLVYEYLAVPFIDVHWLVKG